MDEKLNNKYFIRKTTLGLLTLSSCLLLNQVVNNSIVVQADEINYVSDKAKEVKKELEETLIIKKNEKTHTFKDKVKFDDGVVPNEHEKIYLNAIEEEFNKYPEVVRENVNSITIVRKPNALYGYTYSLSGDVNMNMEYYHPELTNGEPGSIKQTLQVLGHEIGHIFNGKSFKDNYTWSYSRDPEYAKLSKEVYNNTDNNFLIGRWASDFGDYLSYIRGEYKPETKEQQKIMDYMSSLFDGILTPSENHLTDDLKESLEFAKSKNKQLIYDGHLYLDSTNKDINELKKSVLKLRKEINDKIRNSNDNTIHYKTIGIKGINNNEYIYENKGNPLKENIKPEYLGGVNDNEPLVETAKEFNSGVSDNNPIINYKSEYNELIEGKIKPLINEKEEFKGAVNDSNPLINEISELNENSIKNLINNKLKYTESISTNTPVDEKGNLILPPSVDKSEYTNPLSINSPTDENPISPSIKESIENIKPSNNSTVNNTKQTDLVKIIKEESKQERELPNTNSTSVFFGLVSSIISSLSLGYNFKKIK